MHRSVQCSVGVHVMVPESMEVGQLLTSGSWLQDSPELVLALSSEGTALLPQLSSCVPV